MIVQPVEFEAWYRAEHGRVLPSMLLICGDLDEATEATDKAFTRAYERWDRVRRMTAPGAWTHRVAVNVARRRARRQTLERTLMARHRRQTQVAAPSGEASLLGTRPGVAVGTIWGARPTGGPLHYGARSR